MLVQELYLKLLLSAKQKLDIRCISSTQAVRPKNSNIM